MEISLLPKVKWDQSLFKQKKHHRGKREFPCSPVSVTRQVSQFDPCLREVGWALPAVSISASFPTRNCIFFYFQGVLKVRKRVTLTAVTVSIIFSICWLADAVIFLMSYHSTTNSPSDVTWAIAAVMILFNSAVNPFVYALINQRFKEKLKGLIRCNFRSSNQIDVAREVPDTQQPTNNSTQPTEIAE